MTTVMDVCLWIILFLSGKVLGKGSISYNHLDSFTRKTIMIELESPFTWPLPRGERNSMLI